MAILVRNSANGHKRDRANCQASQAQPFKTNWGVRRLFCGGRKDWTDRDVVDRHGRCQARLLRIVCGEANNGVGAKDASRSLRWQIVLTKMDPVSLQRQRYIYPVVDYDLCASGARDP